MIFALRQLIEKHWEFNKPGDWLVGCSLDDSAELVMDLVSSLQKCEAMLTL